MALRGAYPELAGPELVARVFGVLATTFTTIPSGSGVPGGVRVRAHVRLARPATNAPNTVIPAAAEESHANLQPTAAPRQRPVLFDSYHLHRPPEIPPARACLIVLFCGLDVLGLAAM